MRRQRDARQDNETLDVYLNEMMRLRHETLDRRLDVSSPLYLSFIHAR